MATKKSIKAKKPATGLRTITFVVAPDIPESERKALESHWKEALRDPSYTVIVNYDVSSFVVVAMPNDVIVVTAPDLPPTELAKLRKLIDRKLKNNLIVVNYYVNAYTIPTTRSN